MNISVKCSTPICRCKWANGSELDQKYHDEIWGKGIYDDKQLFKMLSLEAMQAGLSWSIILKKWDDLCEAFDDFDPEKIACYKKDKEEELLANPLIIRNKMKIKAIINNSNVFLEEFREIGSFRNYIWSFVDGVPIINNWERDEDVPAFTELSDIISRDLKSKGFKFVGPKIVYSFMQAVGIVNDHISMCDFK